MCTAGSSTHRPGEEDSALAQAFMAVIHQGQSSHVYKLRVALWELSNSVSVVLILIPS